jgi:biotin/lipoate A/B protein ligase family protein
MPLAASVLQEARPQNAVHYFPSLGSTMTEAVRLAETNAPHGTVVIADEQSAGVGRLGRTWISKPDVGIYCSILLRLNLPPRAVSPGQPVTRPRGGRGHSKDHQPHV